MKTLLFAILLSSSSLAGGSLFQQNFIGLNKNEIAKYFSENNRSFKLNTAYINNSYNYLKYEDKVREITVLFFLDDDNQCRMIRIMSDYSNLNDLEAELNQNYKKTEKNLWCFIDDDTTYDVELEEGDWFFTISVKVDKE